MTVKKTTAAPKEPRKQKASVTPIVIGPAKAEAAALLAPEQVAQLQPAPAPATPQVVEKRPTYATQPAVGGSPDDMLDLAKDLAKFIKDNKLSTQVQGRDFVNVEGWQYAGSRLGMLPIVEHVLNISNDKEIKYQAKVTLFDMRSKQTVGAGFAVCSNKENGKKFYQEFAIASMAQTRAIGKAYRNILAWIIRAAGYEPTPAEEMEYSSATGASEEVANAPVAAQPEGPEMINEAQKADISLLLSHSVILPDERLRINEKSDRYTFEYADKMIDKLCELIVSRNGIVPAGLNKPQQQDLDQLPY